MFGYLFTHSLDRTKQIDRSITIIRITSPSKQQQQRGIRGIGGGSNGISSDSSHCSKEEGIPWLIERIILLRFILEEMKIMAKCSRKNSSTKNHVWYKVAYNYTYTALQFNYLLVRDSVFSTCDCFVDTNEKNDTNTSYIGKFEK